MNITGIHNLPYIDLSAHIDLKSYDDLHGEICSGFAKARHLAIHGSHVINEGSINSTGQGFKFKPLYQAYSEFQALDKSHPIKKAAHGLDHNQLTTYLKYVLGGYDLYSRYVLFENCKDEILLEHAAYFFPKIMSWIEDLKTNNIFKSVEGATFFLLEAGGIPLEHCDPASSEENRKFTPEFIHIKTDLDRPFYLIDPASREKTYINTRASWWNERDWHGGEPISKPTYTFRIDGKFTEEFRNRILKND